MFSALDAKCRVQQKHPSCKKLIFTSLMDAVGSKLYTDWHEVAFTAWKQYYDPRVIRRTLLFVCFRVFVSVELFSVYFVTCSVVFVQLCPCPSCVFLGCAMCQMYCTFKGCEDVFDFLSCIKYHDVRLKFSFVLCVFFPYTLLHTLS